MRRKLLSFLILSIFILSGMFLTYMLYNKNNGVKQITERHYKSGAMEALQFWTRSRAYPQNDIPSDKYFKAFHQEKIALKKTVLTPDDSSLWEAMGPLNVPGRMISLALNPQNTSTLYVGSATGGLWRTKTADTGGNWERVTTGFPTLGVMAIAIDPTDTNKIYIGTGEVYGYGQSIGGTVIRLTRGSYGIGILKTADGGQTWVKSLDWVFHQERGVQCLRMNPLNPNTLYAATTEGIYKTTNAGDSWVCVLSVLMGEDIVIHANDTSKVMVSCGNLGSTGSGVYVSTDAGVKWTKSSGIPIYTGKTLLEMYASNPDIVFASVANSEYGIGLYRTDNFGDTWIRVHNRGSVANYQGFFSHWVAVHPSNVNKVIHAGVQIYKSNNGGQTLTTVYDPHVDHHNYTHHPTNPNILYIGCDGGVYRTTNFGDSYQDIGYGLQTAQFYNGFSSSSSDSMLALGGLQDNSTVIFYGTSDWVIRIGGDGCWTATNPANDNVLYGESQYNNIQKSTNRGASFSTATSGMTGGGAAFVAPFIVSPSNPSILYSGRRQVYKTTNAADNWSVTNDGAQLDGNSVLSMAISTTDPDIVYVGTAPTVVQAHIFRTKNGGDSWFNVTGNLPDRYPMDLAVDPNENKTVYVVFGGYGSGHVFKTTDEGNNWDDITGTLSDVPTLSVAIDPLNSDHVYVGNDLGVYVSTDAGVTWNTYNKGLPEAVMAMDLNVSPSNRKLRVATHGNGAYQRALLYEPTVYLASTLMPVPNIVMLNSVMSFEVSVTNHGTATQTDSLTLKLRIVDNADNELYSNIKVICCLGTKESRQIQFDGTFQPQNLGKYTLEFIESGTYQHPVPDTLRQTIDVILAPTVALATVTKGYCPYEYISDGQPLPKGDDVQSYVNLPFPFVFDGYEYDKVQISTNGWVEFGTGSSGTERGLSTSAQIGPIGANENGRLASTARPNKALGPWWEDLNTDISASGGLVSYKTLGLPSNRVFVIQWENMRAYWDASATTARVNFQVRLYESTNIIEYHYGNVVPGTFGGADIGAAIGFKDHIGGDYHFYDIIAGGPGTIGDIVTDLSPLTDWPGQDSCFTIQTVGTSVAQHDVKKPVEISLFQNYPNPFNPTTTIRYNLPKTNKVVLKIYNTLGQEVRTLVNKVHKSGYKAVEWDGKDDFDQPVSSGVYVYKLTVGNKILSKKMLFLK